MERNNPVPDALSWVPDAAALIMKNGLTGEYTKKCKKAAGVLDEICRKEMPANVLQQIGDGLDEALDRLETAKLSQAFYEVLRECFGAAGGPASSGGGERAFRQTILRDIERETAAVKAMLRVREQRYIDRYVAAVLEEQDYETACFRGLLKDRLEALRGVFETAAGE